MQQNNPKEYTLSTGSSKTVRELVEVAFHTINVNIRWDKEGCDEKGYNATTGELVVEVNPKFYRPAEVDDLRGDSSEALIDLAWKPSITFSDMIVRMVKNDIAQL
jgi:GDPmannose 4,6-dehydratase